MLNLVMLSVANKPFMLSVIVLRVVMLNVFILSIVMLNIVAHFKVKLFVPGKPFPLCVMQHYCS
jgi:hypothetical protein